MLTENKIHELFNGKHCLWLEILNKSFENTIKIKRNKPLEFLVVEPEHLKFHCVPSKKKTMSNQKRKSTSRRRKRKCRGFLYRYDFACVTINQTPKIALGVIRAATNDINNIAKERINQIIPHGAKEAKRVLPKIIRGAIEDVYQTPFKLLGNFGKKHLNKIKSKILR